MIFPFEVFPDKVYAYSYLAGLACWHLFIWAISISPKWRCSFLMTVRFHLRALAHLTKPAYLHMNSYLVNIFREYL